MKMGDKIGLLTCGFILLLVGILLFLLRWDWLLATDDMMSEQEKQQKHEDHEKLTKNLSLILMATGAALLLWGLCA